MLIEINTIARWQHAQREASKQLAASKAAFTRDYPGCENAVMVKVGGGTSNTSSKYSRQGDETKTSSYALPPEMNELIDQNLSALGLAGLDEHTQMLSTMLGQNPESDIINKGTLTDLIERTPEDQEFHGEAVAQSKIDPYSSEYKDDTQAAYTERLNETLAGIDSNTMRTGTNHAALLKGQAVAEGERARGADLAQNRSVDSQAAQGSQNMLANIEQFLGAQALQAQQQLQMGKQGAQGNALQAGGQRTQRAQASGGALAQAARNRGVMSETMGSNLQGEGTQQTNSFNAGFDMCCFIFLESLNGVLPWYARKGRDEFQTPKGVKGYKWMANWLVPLMQTNRMIRQTTNWLMVKPILAYGAYHYRVTERPLARRLGWVCKPIFKTWLRVWACLGKD